jgi:hypothetical protein
MLAQSLITGPRWIAIFALLIGMPVGAIAVLLALWRRVGKPAGALAYTAIVCAAIRVFVLAWSWGDSFWVLYVYDPKEWFFLIGPAFLGVVALVVRRLKALQKENQRLRKIIADQRIDMEIM